MASPTLIAFAEADSANVAVISVTSAALTWQAGDVLVCAAVNEGANAAVTMAISNTGSGLAWTAQQSHPSGSDCTTYIWTAVASVGGSGTITVTNGSANASQRTAMGAYQFRAPSGYSIAVGHSVLATGKTTSPQQAALIMSSPDSAVVWAAGDWSAAVAESPSPAATGHTTTTPGPSASPVATQASSTAYTFYLDDLDDETSTGTINFGYSGGSAGPFTIVAVEITSTSVGAGAGPTFLPRGMPTGV